MPFKRRIYSRRLSLTPLIDIIFLLLLFFMLSSTFTRFAEVPLQNAGAGPPDSAEVMPILLQVSGDEIRVNGLPTPLAQMTEALAALRQEDRTALALITVSEGISAQELVDLLVVLRQSPWLQISVLG